MQSVTMKLTMGSGYLGTEWPLSFLKCWEDLVLFSLCILYLAILSSLEKSCKNNNNNKNLGVLYKAL
jgi:hypothetical protein